MEAFVHVPPPRSRPSSTTTTAIAAATTTTPIATPAPAAPARRWLPFSSVLSFLLSFWHWWPNQHQNHPPRSYHCSWNWSTVYAVTLLAASLPYFARVAAELAEQLAAVDDDDSLLLMATDGGSSSSNNNNAALFPRPPVQRVEIALQFVRDHRLAAMIFLHSYLCVLFLIGKGLIKLALRSMRSIEVDLLRERMFTYFLWRFATLPALLEPRMHEFLIWMLWFTTLGFLRMMGFLCKDRLEYLCNTPNTSKAHIRVTTLLVGILAADIGLALLSVYLFRSAGVLLVLLLNVETMVLFVSTCQTLIKYVIHLVDMSKEGIWEERIFLVYYTELITESLNDVVWIMHYILIPQIYIISSPLIILFFLLYLRMYGADLWKKYKQYGEFRRANRNLNTIFQDATAEDIDKFDDHCAICRDPMMTAKKLPCGHLFHATCLRSWLAHHVSCPTCRASLSNNATAAATNQPHPDLTIAQPVQLQQEQLLQQEQQQQLLQQPQQLPPTIPATAVAAAAAATGAGAVVPGSELAPFPGGGGGGVERRERRRFPLDRLARFPGAGVANPLAAPWTRANLENMARQVAEIFPNVPVAAIRADLARTNSVDMTTDNILEGRLN